MRTREFIDRLEHARIVQAIRESEARSSGQIRVYVKRGRLPGDPLLSARKKFQALRMHETRERNAVLIFIAPRAHKFAVVGDEALHQKCGPALWQRVVEKMQNHFRSEQFSEAIVDAIRDIGSVLAEHFPGKADGTNELPDEIVES
jgi:uncharacterized membrane protein